MKKLLLIFIALIQVTFALAQSFPVRVTPQAIPPYPTNLSGYANSGLMNSPLRVQLVLSDVTASSREVRLAVSIEGNGINATSAPVVISAPTLILDGGIPLNLTIAELAPYFEQQNLQGLSSVQYNNPLQDGMYRFCFEVFDAFNGNRLSSKSCATVFLINNDPPFLNKPDNESKITEQNPTNILFQWTPRHINVPNVSYEFSIVEVWDTYIDPQAIFLSSPPLYQEVTTNTSLLYGPIQPLLLAGKRYAWRVRAFATNNGEEVAVFNNNGNSEVFWFDYQGNCELTTNIEVQDVSMTNATISWISHPEHLDFTVEYREEGNNRWYNKTTPRNYITIDEFKPDTIYEYRVIGNCTENSFGQSPIDTFRTLSEEMAEYASCGIDPDPVDLSNQELLTELLVNDVFTAGDFPVYVKEVSGSGSFTGEGYISTPWLATVRIPIKFENIKINTDMKLVDGFVVTTYDPNWGSIVDADEIIEEIVGDDGDVDVINIDVDIIDIEINEEDGTITIITSDGDEITRPGGEDVVYVDNTGETWSVGEDGDVTTGEQAEGGPANGGNTNGVGSGGVKEITSADVRIEFTKGAGYYNFDEVPQNAGGSIANKYDKVPISGGGEYNIPYKAISNLDGHISDILIANATFTNNDYTKDDVIFKTKEGVKVQANWNGNVATLSIRKAFDFGKQQIIATVKPKDSTEKYSVAGSANLWHSASQEVTDVNVTIIPVNNVNVSNSITQQINAIYNPAGVNLAVTVGDRLNIDQSVWDLNNNGQLDVGDSSLLAQYTEEELAINAYFKNQTNYNNKTYYIFVTDLATTDPGTSGFMPLKRQYGFIFDQNNVARTIAHELGHGVFGLEHPFTEYDTNSGATSFLMDYGTGIEFNHMDWEKMHAPGIQIYWFQGDEDGESVSTSLHVSLSINELKYKCENGNCAQDNNGKYYFGYLTPSGQRIVLSEDYTPIFYHGISNDKYTHLIPGTLIGFNKKSIEETNETKFWSILSSNGLNFSGYDNNFEYLDQSIPQDDKSVIIGLPYGGISGESSKWKNYKFILEGLDSFEQGDQSVLNITSDSFKNLGLFSSIQPSKKEAFENIIKITGNEQISVTESELKILKGRYFEIPGITDFTTLIQGIPTIRHDEKAEVFLIVKIAEIQNRYPVLFEKYSKWFDQWNVHALTQDNYLSVNANIISRIGSFYRGNWDEENITSQTVNDNSSEYRKWKDNLSNSNSNLYDFYKTFISGLRNYTDNESEENLNCLGNLKNKTAKEIFECIQTASNDEIKLISQENRQEALKIIATYGQSSDFLLDSEEIVVQRLIKYVPNSTFDRDAFILYLTDTLIQIQTALPNGQMISDNYPLWQLLFDKVDDSKFLFPGDNRNAIMLQLLKHYYKSFLYEADVLDIVSDYQEKILNQPVNSLEALHNELYTFKNDYQNILRRGFTHFKGSTVPGGIFYDPDDFYFSIDASITGVNKIHVQQSLKWGFTSNSIYEEDLEPFELSLMMNLSKESLLNGFTLKDNQGNAQSLPVPAIIIYYVSEVGDEQTKSDIIQSAIDIATLPIPAANLTKLGKLFFYADKISSVSSLLATAHREDNTELANFYNKLSLVTGVVSITEMLTPNKALRDVIASESLTKSADNIVEDVVQFSNEIENIPSGTLNPAEIGASRRILQDNLDDFKSLGIIDGAQELKITNALNKLENGLDFNISQHLVVLGDQIDLGKLTKFETENIDGVLDLVIHGDAERFMIDGVLVDNITDISSWLAQNKPDITDIRLLSCTNVNAAQNLVDHLGEGYKIFGTDGFVRIHSDGGLSTLPRGPDGNTDWYELKKGVEKRKLTSDELPRPPNASTAEGLTEVLSDFVELSNRSRRETILASLEQGYYGENTIQKFTNETDKNSFIDDLLISEKTHNIAKGNLLGNNLDKLNNKIVDAWLQAKDYPTIRLDYSVLKGLSQSGGIDNFIETVLRNSSVGLLESRLRQFGLNRSADAVKARGSVFENTLNRLNDLGDPELGDLNGIIELYSFTRNGENFVKTNTETWLDFFRNSLKKGQNFNGFEAHHIFPVELFQRKSFYTWYENYGHIHYSYNAAENTENLVMTEKFLTNPSSNIPGVHAPHPSYSDRIAEYFDSLFASLSTRYDFTNNSELLEGMEEFHEKLMELRHNIKQEIINKSIKGDTKIDDLWNGNNFNNVKPD